MSIFGTHSLQKLETCHSDIQAVVKKVAELCDIIVVCGHRDRRDQEKAFETGTSKLHYPESKHNSLPSLAVDLAPCSKKGDIDWNDLKSFDGLSRKVKKIASMFDVKLVWGGDFSHFKDRPHYELKHLGQ